MKTRTLMLAGIIAPAVYLVTVVVGGALRPEYSHISDAVSELSAAGAPNKVLLEPLFALYNLLLTAFGVGILLRVRDYGGHRRTLGSVGALALIFAGVVGWIVFFFPQDPGGPPVTFTGTVHVVLGGVLALASMLAILLMGLWFRSLPKMQRLSAYSLVSVSVVFGAGALSAASVASEGLFIEYIGLLERITIGGFLQWLFVTALVVRRRETVNPTSTNAPGGYTEFETTFLQASW